MILYDFITAGERGAQDGDQGRGTLRQAMTTIATATTMMMVYSIMFR